MNDLSFTFSGLMIVYDKYKKGFISLETFIYENIPVASDPKVIIKELDEYYETIYMPENKNW